jgi:hypothetical protein
MPRHSLDYSASPHTHCPLQYCRNHTSFSMNALTQVPSSLSWPRFHSVPHHHILMQASTLCSDLQNSLPFHSSFTIQHCTLHTSQALHSLTLPLHYTILSKTCSPFPGAVLSQMYRTSIVMFSSLCQFTSCYISYMLHT